MFSSAQKRNAGRLGLRTDRGATDPILVIASIAVTLILLIGGSFAISGIITNGKNLNAKGDLDKISVAEAAYYAQNDGFIDYHARGTGANDQKLEKSGVGFTPTAGKATDIVVIVQDVDGENGWIAVSLSDSGTKYYKTSASQKTVEGVDASIDLTAADIATLDGEL